MIYNCFSKTFLCSNRSPTAVTQRGKYYNHCLQQNHKIKSFTHNLISNFFTHITIRHPRIVQFNGFKDEMIFLCTQLTLFKTLRLKVQQFQLSLQKHSFLILSTCAQQCECVLAHRIRRGQQIFNLYSKLWDEVALREFGHRLRQQFARRGKELLFGAVGVSAFNWDDKRISDVEMNGHTKEIEEIRNLSKSTVTCSRCQQRKVIDKEVSSTVYCQCSDSEKKIDPAGWLPFLERENVLVWRKEHAEYKGLYAFKVYGKYDDVTAEDFLQAQVDTTYRKEWDNTAVTLKVVDSEPKTNSDIVYWEMQWPKLFSNRDYVFNRRYTIYEEQNLIVIVNKCTEHPRCPERPENHRVKEYWSYMVIKPFTQFSQSPYETIVRLKLEGTWDYHMKCADTSYILLQMDFEYNSLITKECTPGIEFVLTYFDNPGISMPTALTSWVAMSGLPDFLTRLRKAALELNKRRKRESQHKIVETASIHRCDLNQTPSPDDSDNRIYYLHKLNGSHNYL